MLGSHARLLSGFTRSCPPLAQMVFTPATRFFQSRCAVAGVPLALSVEMDVILSLRQVKRGQVLLELSPSQILKEDWSD